MQGDRAAIVLDCSASSLGRQGSAKKKKNRTGTHSFLPEKICLEIAGFFVLRQEKDPRQSDGGARGRQGVVTQAARDCL